MIKRFAVDQRNTTTLEKSLLHECTDLHLSISCDPNHSVFKFYVGLVDPRPATKKVSDFLTEELELDPAIVSGNVRMSLSS